LACATNARSVRCRRSGRTSGAAPEMEDRDPPGSPCRGRPQTTASCASSMAGVVSIAGNGALPVRQV
jgi:hypothetical protein